MKTLTNPSTQSPLQIEYNKLVENKDKLKHAIATQMRQIVSRGLDPSWENFSKTQLWLVLQMNLIQENRDCYEKTWNEIYSELLGNSNNSESSDTPGLSDQNQ